MRFQRPYVATMDQVRISRNEEEAIIEYVESGVSTTHFRLGPQVWKMTDQDILDRFNEHIEGTEWFRAQHKHVAIEISPGKPQIRYSAESYQWTPRGDVLRCVISDGGLTTSRSSTSTTTSSRGPSSAGC